MENNFMQLLQSQLNDDQFIGQLSRQIGGANPQQTKAAADGIMATLMNAMAKNAATPDGASALANALDNDHDGSVLDNIMDVIAGGGQAAQQQPRALNGAGIIGHLLGGKQNGAIQMISQMSGLDKNKTGNLMTMLAPIIMGALGRTKRQNGLDVGDLFNLLNGSVTQKRQQSGQAMDLISRFIDQDGDGDVTDELLAIGKNLLMGGGKKSRGGGLLGGLFGRK